MPTPGFIPTHVLVSPPLTHWSQYGLQLVQVLPCCQCLHEARGQWCDAAQPLRRLVGLHQLITGGGLHAVQQLQGATRTGGFRLQVHRDRQGDRETSRQADRGREACVDGCGRMCGGAGQMWFLCQDSQTKTLPHQTPAHVPMCTGRMMRAAGAGCSTNRGKAVWAGTCSSCNRRLAPLLCHGPMRCFDHPTIAPSTKPNHPRTTRRS